MKFILTPTFIIIPFIALCFDYQINIGKSIAYDAETFQIVLIYENSRPNDNWVGIDSGTKSLLFGLGEGFKNEGKTIMYHKAGIGVSKTGYNLFYSQDWIFNNFTIGFSYIVIDPLAPFYISIGYLF